MFNVVETLSCAEFWRKHVPVLVRKRRSVTCVQSRGTTPCDAHADSQGCFAPIVRNANWHNGAESRLRYVAAFNKHGTSNVQIS